MAEGGGHAIQRWMWDLRRFGLGPGDLVKRLRPDRRLPKVVCVSLPKAGTHLLERLLCLHPWLYRRLLPTLNDQNLDRHGGFDALLASSRPSQILVAHLEHRVGYDESLQRHGARGLFMVRDPRDLAVSLAFFIPKRPEHPFHRLFSELPDVESRIRLAIQGSRDAGFPSMAERLVTYRGWLQEGAERAIMPVRFEDLIGERGGGGRQRQREVVEAILRHLGVAANESLLERLCEETFSEVSPTFRSGRIGGYRSHFEGTDLDEECRASFGNSLRQFGYT